MQYFSISYSAIDDSGGYLHHDPVKAGKIVIACACLHNVAVEKGIPLPACDDDSDGIRPLRQPRQQPQPNPPAGRGDEHNTVRANYIREHFSRN